MIFAIIGCNLIGVAFFAILIYIKLKNNRLNKLIILWLEDAIEVKAYSKRIGENQLGFQPKATKIQVKFFYSNNWHIKESTAKVFGGQVGYVGTFNKYANREINILYSPRYDEVLILKDK